MPSDNGEQTFSIWLIPEEPEFHALQSIIRENQRNGNQPLFIPHITLLSRITFSSNLKESIQNLCNEAPRLMLQCKKPEIGKDYFHCLFVPIVKSDGLNDLKNRASNLFTVSSPRLFRPHVSLMYHDPDSDLVRNTQDTLPDFTSWQLKFSRIELWNTSGLVNNWTSVFP